jgi:hypothetical protein
MVELLLQGFHLSKASHVVYFVEPEKTEGFVSEVPDLGSEKPFLLGLQENGLTKERLENHLLIVAGFFRDQLESVLKGKAINILHLSCLLEVVEVVCVDKFKGWPRVQTQIHLDIESLVPQARVLLLEQETHGLVLLQGRKEF